VAARRQLACIAWMRPLLAAVLPFWNATPGGARGASRMQIESG